VARSPRLDDAQVRERLARLTGWTLRQGRLHREFEFRDFARAFAFMTAVARLAEERDHHPDWSNSWNRVVIDLVSHDVKGLSARDFDLASAIDGLPRPDPGP